MPNVVMQKKRPIKDFAADVLSVWSPLPSYDPIFRPHLHTEVRIVYLYKQVRGGGVELTVENVRGAIVHKAGRKYQHDWL